MSPASVPKVPSRAKLRLLLFGAPSVPASSFRKVISKLTLGLAALTVGSALAGAQLSTFAGNDQHTNVYAPAAANINKVLWQTPIDTSNSGAFAHYGEPL